MSQEGKRMSQQSADSLPRDSNSLDCGGFSLTGFEEKGSSV